MAPVLQCRRTKEPMNIAKTYLTRPVEHLDITQFNIVPLAE
jgi:hypothetical protein